MTDQKFCFGCQKFRPVDDVQVLKRNGRNRMVCSVCQARCNTSPYAKKAKPPNQEAA